MDLDKARFESNLSQLVRKFRHFEAVSYEKQEFTESSTDMPIRWASLHRRNPNKNELLRLTSAVEEAADGMEREMKTIFDKFDVDGNPEFRLAVLARITQKLMQESI